jgi:hypothetical protein
VQRQKFRGMPALWIVQRFNLRPQLARSHHSTNKIVDIFAVQQRFRRNRYSRGNTITVTDNVTFFLPVTQETLEDKEREAVMRHIGVDVIHCATPARAIIGLEVYHSSMYTRKGNTCSSLVEVKSKSNTVYGRIVKFILHQSNPIALVKVMHPHNLNICKESSRPSLPFLRKLNDDNQLANSILAVEELDEVISVSCYAIKRKCIFY